MTEQHKGSYD